MEADTGEIGVGVSTAGVPARFVVERHMARFVDGADPRNVELIWDQMWRATMFYGRKGLVLNAISAVDLALWDLLGRLRDEPVHSLIGGPVRDEIDFYATGPRPDLAKELGFVDGRLPLVDWPTEGDDGLRATSRRRSKCEGASAKTSSSPTTAGWRSTSLTR